MDATALVAARVTNLIARRVPSVSRKATARQAQKFRLSAGRKGNTLAGRPVFLLDVVGRLSGELRPVMLMHVPRGDDLVVLGSGAETAATPNWYKNLKAAGGADVQVGGDRRPVTPRELEGGPEHDQCWSLAGAAYPGFDSYQNFTPRQIPVAVLERRDAA
jgi:F420H(2)-dependent quinone reductase